MTNVSKMQFHRFGSMQEAVAFLQSRGFSKVSRDMWRAANGHVTSIAHAALAGYFVVSTAA